VVVPLACGGSGCDGDATLLLLHHPVHGGSALVHLADLVRLTGVVQDALAGGGLLRCCMKHTRQNTMHAEG
jgi:hypothetical protein